MPNVAKKNTENVIKLIFHVAALVPFKNLYIYFFFQFLMHVFFYDVYK